MKKFLVFGIDRTDSTLATSLLNSHPLIHCDGELFGTFHWRRWRRPLLQAWQRHSTPYITFRRTIQRYRKQVNTYGFKLKVDQISHPEQKLPQLHRAGWHILYLSRLSVFDPVILALAARHTGRWHNRWAQDHFQVAPFVIDKNQFQGMLTSRLDQIRRCRVITDSLPHLPLIYEQDLQSSQQWDVTIARICDCVGLAAPPIPVNTPLNKTWSQPYSEIVANYAELFELARQYETND